MIVASTAIEVLESTLSQETRERIGVAVTRLAEAKARGGKVVVITGSGPNVHEGVTTLVAELMRLGVVDGVTTSSAVVAHEMGGVLERVKRVDGRELGLAPHLLPRGNTFEMSLLHEDCLSELESEMSIDAGLMEKLEHLPGTTIIKAAGNLAYPLGLYLERIAPELSAIARERGVSFEEVAGLGADPRTMIGAGARLGLPVLVTIPQLVGGGMVGSSIGDSMSITERSRRIADMLGSADVIIESAVALTQEIHDGPLETYTGHGLWAAWDGLKTYSLRDKTIVRIDLDPALDRVWRAEREGSGVQQAIDKGLPKTKLFDVPFRMEMSGFARLEGSVPVVGDIGVVWPVMVQHLVKRLGLHPEFMSSPQQTPEGKGMREWIVEAIRPFSRKRMMESSAVARGASTSVGA